MNDYDVCLDVLDNCGFSVSEGAFHGSVQVYPPDPRNLGKSMVAFSGIYESSGAAFALTNKYPLLTCLMANLFCFCCIMDGLGLGGWVAGV